VLLLLVILAIKRWSGAVRGGVGHLANREARRSWRGARERREQIPPWSSRRIATVDPIDVAVELTGRRSNSSHDAWDRINQLHKQHFGTH
jgi:hypothetical protein